MNAVPIKPARLRWRDRLELGASGLRARPGRTLLSALGIAIGITALVAVTGLAASSKAQLMAELDALGTNLLAIAPGSSMTGTTATLPQSAPGMVGRVPTVEQAAATYAVQANVYRTDAIPAAQSSGIAVLAADLELLDTVRAEVAQGRWLDEALGQYPAVVLGSTAARRLGIVEVSQPIAVWLADQWFAVVGVLAPSALAPELDSAALIGAGAARYLQPDTPLSATTIYVRVIESAVVDTRAVLGRTANPANPSEVLVSRPSDALRARTAADQSYTTLSLGLGAVGLLVGGIGIANVMVIAVLERRREIGVRRSLGATRGSIRSQFLLESVLLGLLGGVCGAGFGAGATVVFSLVQGWSAQVPWVAMGLGAGASVVIGALAGWYPAARAARVPPTEALRTA